MASLWNGCSSIYFESDVHRDERAENLTQALPEHGLGLTIFNDGSYAPVDVDTLIQSLGGGETTSNLNTLSSWLSAIRNTAAMLTRAQFRHRVRGFVQAENRSVCSALRNLGQNGGKMTQNMTDFIVSFVGKDIKHPVRFLKSRSANTDYGRVPELEYSESETGTYHTLQIVGENSAWHTISGYLEDSPLCRRYLRYIDHLASDFGMRLVYCPCGFANLSDIGQPARPNFSEVDGAVIRTQRATDHRLLYVSLTFDYSMFRDLTFVETESQPNQQPQAAHEIDYSPIFVDNLPAIITVMKTLGSFAECKLYYKHYRTHAR